MFQGNLRGILNFDVQTRSGSDQILKTRSGTVSGSDHILKTGSGSDLLSIAGSGSAALVCRLVKLKAVLMNKPKNEIFYCHHIYISYIIYLKTNKKQRSQQQDIQLNLVM